MSFPCFAVCESASSHHEPTPLSTRKPHENRCRVEHPLYTRSPRSSGLPRRALLLLLVVLLSWTSLCGSALASDTNGDRPTPYLDDTELAWKGSALHLDQRPPPVVSLLMPPLQTDDDASTTTTAPPSKRAIATDPKGSDANFDVPKPFDTGFSNNLTDTCAEFLNRLRTDDALNSCHPFSLLLQTSSGFFDASKSYLRITQTLDSTCAADSAQCKATMDGYARELVTINACKTDYDNDNPMVLQAYNGLIAYMPSYLASCLRDDEGKYCFANAVTNTTSPSDAFPYYLPIGQEMPGGSRPTCNSCLQQAMSVYSQYANNVTQPISKTYSSAAHQMSIACGSRFVNVTAAPVKGAAPASTAAITPTLTLLLMFILYFFQ